MFLIKNLSPPPCTLPALLTSKDNFLSIGRLKIVLIQYVIPYVQECRVFDEHRHPSELVVGLLQLRAHAEDDLDTFLLCHLRMSEAYLMDVLGDIQAGHHQVCIYLVALR